MGGCYCKTYIGWTVLGSLGIALQALAAGEPATWDADANTPGVQAGPGVWNSSSSNWQVAGANVQWSNTAGYTAVFSAAPGGLVTLPQARSAGEEDRLVSELGRYVQPELVAVEPRHGVDVRDGEVNVAHRRVGRQPVE